MRKISALKGSLRRLFMLFAAVITAAIFANIGLSQPTYAADAIWVGSTLKYEDNDYAPISTTGLPAGDVKGKVPYAWIDNSSTPAKAHVIYFEKSVPGPDGENIQARTSAVYVVYNFTPPSTYSGLSPPVTTPIKVTRDLTTDSNDQNQEMQNTCDGSITKGLGWIICPVSNYIADGIDGIFSLVQDFLDVRPIAKDDTGLYQMWDLVRNLANICFIIIFLVIIYSHLTSAGYSNYNVKDMLPRLIIASILVNASFWICALGVDLSNTVAHSTHAVMENIRENMTTGADVTEVTWSNITAYILSAGAVPLAGIAMASTAAVSFFGAGYLLLAALISVAFSVLVAFVILAARHALIIMFVVISPLAFVAFVLPSTKSWFSKWLKTFTMLMLFAVIFSFIYGGSQLAGALIMNSADGRLHIAILGMLVQFLPLMLSLIIPRLATGILGQIANITNDKSKGLLDKSKGWATDNANAHRMRKLAKTADDVKNRKDGKLRGRDFYKGRGLGRLGMKLDQGRRDRERDVKDSDHLLDSRAAAARQERISNRADKRSTEMYNAQMSAHDYHKRDELYTNRVAAAGDKHWQQQFDATDAKHFDRDLHQTDIKTRLDKQYAETAEARYNAIIEGMRAGINPYNDIAAADATLKGAGSTISKDVGDMARLAVRMDAANNAKHAAEIKLKNLVAEEYKASFEGDKVLLKEAAGVGGELGETRVYAAAKKAATDAAVELVEINRSLASDMSRFDLHDVLFKGIMPNGSKASLEMKQAAMYALLQNKGNNQDANEIRDAIGKLGMVQVRDAVTGKVEYYEAKRNSKGQIEYDANMRAQADMSKGVISNDEVSLRRDWQQFFDDAKSKSPHSMVTYSGTNGSESRSGLMVEDIRGGFIRDALGGKFGAEKMLKADIDELKTLYSDMSNPDGYYNGTLSADQRAKVNGTLEAAIIELQNNDNVNSSIDDRNRAVMNELLAKIDPSYKQPDGSFAVNKDNRAIVKPSAMTGDEVRFETPDAVAPARMSPSYYSDRDISFH